MKNGIILFSMYSCLVTLNIQVFYKDYHNLQNKLNLSGVIHHSHVELILNKDKLYHLDPFH